ncbi:MAG TPA: 5-formyltetrahydrofolate cyclo-ligase [bacterium]|nr:5-formyltetrahydrofolate cyclo-ligase [bacterium]
MKASSPAPHSESKANLREKLKKVRDQVDPALAETASQGVWILLSRLPEFNKAKGIGAFASTPGEINTYPILEGVLASGKKLYLPRVAQERTHFDYFPVPDFKNLSTGAFGILEPTGIHPAAWEDIDIALVPGLAFDLRGYRLGFGKGYYDRVLPLLKKNALTIGLGYSFQIVEKIPDEPHDAILKAILSEKGFHHCKND